MKESMDSAFSLMNSTMSQLMGKQDQSDKRLQRLQKKLTDVEQEVHSKTQELNEGVKVLVNNTNELRSTIRQAGEFNEYVYFRIFNRIAQKVGMEKNGWKKLNTALLEDYPEVGMQEFIHSYNYNYVHPPGGWIYYFCFFRRPMSGVRCPASRMVSAHLKEKY